VAVQRAPAKSRQDPASFDAGRADSGGADSGGVDLGGADSGGVDLGGVDPAWPPPSGPSGSDATGRKSIPAWLVYSSILLVLVLLVAAVWAFGGFERRTDILKTMPPGTPFTTGPYEFRFTEATAQHWTDYDGAVYWKVVMVGEGRTTGKESISPSYMPNSGMFISKDDVTQQISQPELTRIGQEDFSRSNFTPGLPHIPFSVIFKYDDRYRPGPTIRFVVWDVVYGKHFIASDEESWHNGNHGYQLYLPVRVLPPVDLR
jgi:hypothetical protein